MLCDDVVNDKDYIGFKRATEDRELRKYNSALMLLVGRRRASGLSKLSGELLV